MGRTQEGGGSYRTTRRENCALEGAQDSTSGASQAGAPLPYARGRATERLRSGGEVQIVAVGIYYPEVLQAPGPNLRWLEDRMTGPRNATIPLVHGVDLQEDLDP